MPIYRLTPAVLALALALTSRISGAQAGAMEDPVTESRALRDGGDFKAAVRLLRPHVATNPSDHEAARLLGETLYWLGDRVEARSVFESALARHSSDTELRLTYGRMLIETGAADRAHDLLEPLIGTPSSRGRAETQLGLAAYWNGDLRAARRLFSSALAADGSIAEARSSLREILLRAAPRVHIDAQSLSDNQPLDRTGLRASAGTFVTPLLGITAHVEPLRFRLASGAPTSLTMIGGDISAYVPSARTEIDIAGGTIAGETSSEWTGRLRLGLRPSRGLTLRARGERWQYLNTVASIPSPVMVETVGVMVDWTHPHGWLAQASASRDLFADDNDVTAAFAWILAPIARGEGAEMHIGYSFATQDSEESRYSMSSDGTSSIPTGAYTPYYTPLDVRSHSALVNLLVRIGSRITFRSAAAYGVGQETAESVRRRQAGPFQPATYVIVRAPRTFSPWNARGSADLAIGEHLTLSASAEMMHTSFYRASTIRVGLVRLFTTPSLRRLDGR